jgi:probable F420-dependent oxidoreductase
MSTTSTGLDVGIVLPPYATTEQLRSVAATADATGIHSLWVTDRTVVGMPWLETLTTLGALAALTERVRIGSSVLVLPRRNPVLLAQSLATVEHLTGGRLIAGFGVGDPTITGPAEMHLAGVDPAVRGRLADDYLALLQRLWTEDDVTYDSPVCRADGITLGLKPTTAIPVWIGGGTPAARRRAGRTGDGWLALMSTPDRFPAELTEVQESARRHGRDPDAVVPAVYLFGAIDTDGTSAERLLDGALQGFMGAPLAAIADGCVWGTPDDWCRRLTAWDDAGARSVNVALFSADLRSDVRLIGEHVVPALSRQPTAAR